ncbi:MAG: histidine ammonia-lyase, partial [bacterium]|nr:histidine ammonia-lyase [bacterium]
MFNLSQKLTLERFVNVCGGGERIFLSPAAKKKIIASSKMAERIAGSGKAVYGINTGFGGLSNKLISWDKIKRLQKNLILSHACGVDGPLPKNGSRGVLILLINSLSKGYSGIRLKTLEVLIKIFNKGIIPLMPSKGSVGASGDLVPLAHLSLLLLGEGKAFYGNKTISGRKVLKLINEKPLDFFPKEGLALVNGTHAMTSLLAFSVFRAKNLSKIADIAGAISFKALEADSACLDEKIHALKPHPGQISAALNLKRLLKGSQLAGRGVFFNQKKILKNQIQDAYSLRCLPQVHGASKDAISHAQGVVEIEMNSVTDNPLLVDGKFLSGGNFHGQPLALAADFLAMAVSELGDISERRLDRLVNPLVSGLPPFLAKNSGLNSGFMIAQYTAAALLNYNKVLCHPAVIDSIPTSGQQEDHVSMGMTSCLKLIDVCSNTEKILAIEMLGGVQALDLAAKLKECGPALAAAYYFLRKHVLFL